MTARAMLGVGACVAAMVVAAVAGERAVIREAHHSRVVIVYWEKWTGTEGAGMRKIVDQFNASQDKIYCQYLSISSVDTKTMLATAGGDPPDVAGLWGGNVCQFADANALTDLTQMARDAGLGPDYYIPGYWDMMNYHGRLWALPSTPATACLVVNADLVPPQYRDRKTFPQTIEAFDKVIDESTIYNKDGTLKVAGFLPGEPGWWQYSWPIWFGGSLVKGDKLTIDTPEAERAFSWIATFNKRFGFQTVQNFQNGFGGGVTPLDAFVDGKVATELHGVYKAIYIVLFKPKMHWFAVPFPHPADRPDLAGRGILDSDVLMIPRGAKHPTEAFEFIRFVQRQDVMERLNSYHGKNTPLAKVSDDFLNHHLNKEIRVFDALARNPRSFHAPKIGIWPQISTEFNEVFQEVNTGLKTPKQALADAQARLDGEWKTYREQVLDE